MDRQGRILDQHKSRLEIQRQGKSYHQVNTYTWADGKKEVRIFDGEFRDGWLHFNTDRLTGKACEVGKNTIVLNWVYNDKPDQPLAELITLMNDMHRARTWQYIEDGKFTKVMLIEEDKVA
jgi:hypothetical protein